MVFSMAQSVLYAQAAFSYICSQPISPPYILQFALWTLSWTQPYLSILLVWLFSVACTLHAYFRSIFTDSVIFALELAGVSILIVLCCLFNGYYHPRPCRAELRRPICNIFVTGTRVKVAVLRKSSLNVGYDKSNIHTEAPPNATTAWLVEKLEERHLLLDYRKDARLTYELLLFPGDGSRPRPLDLLGIQDLVQAGVTNDCTIQVRYCLPGGARNAAGT